MTEQQGGLPPITADTKRSWRRVRHDHSAGGVAYRHANGDLHVALIATRGATRWQLPKGSCELGETAVETALREVEEEAGLLTACEGFLRRVEYWYWDTHRKEVPELVHKEVDFYLLRVVGGHLNSDCNEVDEVGWFTPESAVDLLTFDGERETLEEALRQLGAS